MGQEAIGFIMFQFSLSPVFLFDCLWHNLVSMPSKLFFKRRGGHRSDFILVAWVVLKATVLKMPSDPLIGHLDVINEMLRAGKNVFGRIRCIDSDFFKLAL